MNCSGWTFYWTKISNRGFWRSTYPHLCILALLSTFPSRRRWQRMSSTWLESTSHPAWKTWLQLITVQNRGTGQKRKNMY
ncbi:hypothetical protein OSTOST_12534, partial [Ostertagia ostertagi]